MAMPTGHVFRWHLRIMMQPSAISGAVAKPNSSAPRSAAIATSRPCLSWPSACSTIRERSLFSTSVWCASASPSSHGSPACLMPVHAAAPVPPSPPEIDDVGFGLRDARRDDADADLGDELHRDARLGGWPT